MAEPYWKELIKRQDEPEAPKEIPYWKQLIKNEVVEPEPPIEPPKKEYDNYNTYLSEYDKLHDKTKESLKSFTYGDDFNSEDGTPQSLNNPREYAMFMMNNEDNINQESSPFITEQGQIARNKIIKQDMATRRQSSVNGLVVDLMSGGELTTDDLELVQKATTGDSNAAFKLEQKKSSRNIHDMLQGSKYINPERHAQDKINFKKHVDEYNLEEDENRRWWNILAEDPAAFMAEKGDWGAGIPRNLVQQLFGTALNYVPVIHKSLTEQAPLNISINMSEDLWKKQQLKNADKLEQDGDIKGANTLRTKAEKDFKDETLRRKNTQESMYKAVEDKFYGMSQSVHKWADEQFPGKEATGTLAKPAEDWMDWMNPLRIPDILAMNSGTMAAMALEAYFVPNVALAHAMALGGGSVAEANIRYEKENNVKLTPFQKQQSVHIVGAATAVLNRIGFDAILKKLPKQLKGKVLKSFYPAFVEGETEKMEEFLQVWASVKGDIPLYGMTVEGVGYRDFTDEDAYAMQAGRLAGFFSGGIIGSITNHGEVDSETEFSSSNPSLANNVIVEKKHYRPDLGKETKTAVGDLSAEIYTVKSVNKNGEILNAKKFFNKKEADEYASKQKLEIEKRLTANGGVTDVDGEAVPDGQVVKESNEVKKDVYESNGEVIVSDLHDSQIDDLSKEVLSESEQISLPKRTGKRSSSKVSSHINEQINELDKVIIGIEDKIAKNVNTPDYYKHIQTLQKAVDLKEELNERLKFAEDRVETQVTGKDTSLESELEPEVTEGPVETQDTDIQDGVIENEDGTFNAYSKGDLIAEGVDKYDAEQGLKSVEVAENITDSESVALLNAGFGLTKQSIQDIFGKIVKPGKFKFTNLPKALQDEAEKKGITEENFVDLFGQITGKGKGSFTEVQGLDKKQNAFFNKVLNKGIKKWFSEKPKRYQIKFLNPEAFNLLKHLTKEEVSELTPGKADALVSIFNKLEEDNVVKNLPYMAMAGIVKKGWYKGSAKAIVDVFGTEDGYRFAALLSAMSPQTSVESNLKNALNVWVNWDKAGRPSGTDAISKILKIMGESVEGDKGIKSVLGAWRNNSFRAFNAENPKDIQISGPKVQSFFQNLIGNDMEVTNDAWMANLSFTGEGGVTQDSFKASKTKKNTDLLTGKESEIGRKSGGYLAMSAAVRKAAKTLNNMKVFKEQGITWTPAEVQETVWSWAKAVLEARTKDTDTIPKMVEKGVITDEVIAGTPDFAQLLQIPIFKDILKGTKYEKRINKLEKTERVVIETGLKRKSKNIRESATRLENLHHQREFEKETLKGVPSDKEIIDAKLPKNITPLLFKNRDLKEGTLVGVRLNLHGKVGNKRVQTIHRKNYNGKALGYDAVVTVTNATFAVYQKARDNIYNKITNKYNMASVNGGIKHTEPNFSGVLVKFNPMREHLFVRADDGRAVKSASEVTIFDRLAYVRGEIEYWGQDAPKPLTENSSDAILDTDDGVAYMQGGFGITGDSIKQFFKPSKSIKFKKLTNEENEKQRIQKQRDKRSLQKTSRESKRKISIQKIDGFDSSGDFKRKTGLPRTNQLETRHASHTPGKQFTSQIEENGGSSPVWNKLTGKNTNKVFLNAINNAVNELGDFGASVEIPSEIPKGSKVYLTADAKAGFIIKPGGDISAVFNSPSSPNKKVTHSLLTMAVQAGGRKLDAFNVYLTDIYAGAGFKPVSKTPFNPDYKPEGWNYESFKEWNNGKPDVYAFVYDPDFNGEFNPEDIQEFKEYADAIKHRDDILNNEIEGLVYLQGGIGLTQASIKGMLDSIIKPKRFSHGMLPEKIKKQGKILGITSDNFIDGFSKAAENLGSLAKNTKAWYKKTFSYMKRWYKGYAGKPIYDEASLSQDMDNKYSEVNEESQSQITEDSNTGKKPKNPHSITGVISYIGEVLSVRAKKVGVEVKKVLRDYQRGLEKNVKEDMERAEPLLAVLKKLKEDAPNTSRKLDIAILARDAEMINEIISQYPDVEVKVNKKLVKVDLKKAFDANKDLLLDMWFKGDEAFGGLGFIEEETGKIGYFPKEVHDLDGLRTKLKGMLVEKFGEKEANGIIDNALYEYAKKKEMTVEQLTTSETSKVINQVIMGRLKSKKGSGFKKSRTIESDDIKFWSQIAPFYSDSSTSLINYINNLNQGVAKQKLFGRGINPDTLEFEEDYEGTIGGLYADKLLAKENYTPDQQREIVEIFSTLMEAKKTPKYINDIKAWGYLGTMADVINTLTQLGDTALALGRSLATNPLDVGTSFIKAARNKSDISARDVYIEDISAEMRTAEGMMKTLDSIFTITGLKKLDMIGKETLINSQVMKFRKDAKIYNKQKGLDKDFWSTKALEFELKMSESFNASEFDAVIKELLAGEFTPNTITLAHNVLLDHQPTSPTELPAGYHDNPQARIFYQLKTWSIKTMNIFVEDIQGNNVAANRLEKEGNIAAAKKLRRSGYKKAVQLGLVLTMAGATVDEIKDFLLGKPSNFSDNVYESLLRLIFLSKYSSEKMFKGEFSTFWDSVSEVPLIGIGENLTKDAILIKKWFSGTLTDKESMTYGLRLPQYVPVVGKFIYYGSPLSSGMRGRKMELKRAITRYKQQANLSASEKRMLRMYEREIDSIKSYERKGKSSSGGSSGRRSSRSRSRSSR